MIKKISGVYKITNTVTKDFYVGSSKDVKRRWAEHKCLSTWNKQTNNPMYQDMNELGVNKFEFQILEEVEIDRLKEKEQQFIETLHPTYNNYNAKGFDVERQKKYQKEYQKSNKLKEYKNKYNNHLCFYSGETLTLNTLSLRFYRSGIEHPVLEAKKYLISNCKVK